VVKLAVQVGGQLIPGGLLETVPVAPPLPTTLTVSVGTPVKVAVTCWFALRVKAQVELVLPVQEPPDQPTNVELAAAVSVSVT